MYLQNNKKVARPAHLKWLLFFLFLVFIFGINLAPAEMMGKAISMACSQKCMIVNTEGRFWQGEGSLYFSKSTTLNRKIWQNAGRVSWDISHLGVLTANIRDGKIKIDPTSDGFIAEINNIRFPANNILPLFQKVPQQGWGGEIVVNQLNFHKPWNGSWFSKTDGDIDWTHASSTLIPDKILGNFNIRYLDDAIEQNISVKTTNKNLLDISGSIMRNQQASWTGEISIKKTDSRKSTEIDVLLSSFATKVSETEYKMKF